MDMDILVLSSWLWQWSFLKVFLLPQKIGLRRATIKITSFSQNCEYELISGEDYGFTMFWWLALIFFWLWIIATYRNTFKIGMRQRSFKFHTMLCLIFLAPSIIGPNGARGFWIHAPFGGESCKLQHDLLSWCRVCCATKGGRFRRATIPLAESREGRSWEVQNIRHTAIRGS